MNEYIYFMLKPGHFCRYANYNYSRGIVYKVPKTSLNISFVMTVNIRELTVAEVLIVSKGVAVDVEAAADEAQAGVTAAIAAGIFDEGYNNQ
jgi:hypothetical protein